MKKEVKHSVPGRFDIEIGLICFVANIVAVVVYQTVISELIPPAVQIDFNAIIEVIPPRVYNFSVNIAPFIIPFILVVWYSNPVGAFFRRARKGDAGIPSEKVLRRLVNMPFMVSLLSTAGWLSAFLIICGLTLVSRRMDPSGFMHFFIVNFVSFGTTAVQCFVMTYYLLDHLTRKKYIPYFFPAGELSRIKGAIRLPVHARFHILATAISLYPVFVLGLGLNVVSEEPSKIRYAFIFIGLFIPVAMALVMFISRAFQLPLVEMTEVTDEIGRGNLDGSVKVRSGDELGALGDAINMMTVSLREKEYIKDTFGRIVDPRVRDFLLKGNARLGGSVQRGVVLFSDIRGFTALSESTSPERVVAQLNRYFERMSGIVAEHGGYVNKYIGDAILALFGYPIEIENRSDRALHAANAMIRAMDGLNGEFIRDGFSPIAIGAALHSGELLAGNIGSASRMEFTVIGDTVNVASRIEGLTKRFGTPLLVSGPFRDSLSGGEPFRIRYIGRARIRGRREYVDLHESIDAFPEQTAALRYSLCGEFEEALGLFRDGDFAGAETLFRGILAEDPGDGVSAYYAGRAGTLAGEGVSGDWDGVA